MMTCHRNDVIVKQCEAIIEEGFDAMYKVDRALSIIEDMELYKPTYQSFDAYCLAKWQMNVHFQHLCIKEELNIKRRS